jgi:hypothetical protein
MLPGDLVLADEELNYVECYVSSFEDAVDAETDFFKNVGEEIAGQFGVVLSVQTSMRDIKSKKVDVTMALIMFRHFTGWCRVTSDFMILWSNEPPTKTTRVWTNASTDDLR